MTFAHTPSLSRFVHVGLLATVVAGCSASPSVNPAAASDPSAVYSRYVVQLHGDAPPTVVHSTITGREEEVQRLARESPERSGELQEAITQDNACVGSSLWLYDLEWRRGDMACVSGKGTLNLDDLSTVGTFLDMGADGWQKSVRSYWAGSESGGFWGPPITPGTLFCGSGFAAYGPAVDQVDYCTSLASQVFLN